MASLLSYALCTVADVKENLGIPSSDTSKDNLIIRKINQATIAIENYTGRRFKETTYTDEEYDSTSTDQLILRQRPVSSLLSLGVRDSGLNENDWENTETNQYFLDSTSGVLDLNFRAIGRWNRYRVTYTAGYPANVVWPDGCPEDIREACASLAAYYANNANTFSIGVAEKQEGQRKIRYANSSSAAGFGGGGTSFDGIIAALGIDGILNAYSNYPVLTDR